MEEREYGVLGGKIGRIKGSNMDPAWLAGELLVAKIIGTTDFKRASNPREVADERLGELVEKVMRNGAPGVFQTFVSILLKLDDVKWLGEELKGDVSSRTFFQPPLSLGGSSKRHLPHQWTEPCFNISSLILAGDFISV